MFTSPTFPSLLVGPDFFNLQMMEATLLIGTLNAAANYLCIDTILSRRSTDNSLDFMAWSHLYARLEESNQQPLD
ncbi:hypothetical protein EXN66_Car004964 [Channa argus]|uniref:Uncharacterized protein n=1 Tax=Channa argus TaxID=215402 RepID=A0A6G1PGD1_CHAAH|nr:hypothetical protein EXN66_Car004964 [Channa argus]